nr:hypothetical protein [Tanacetum cinerariifolium]
MKTRGFWDAVITYFEKETGSTRGYDSFASKWKNRIRPRIGAFCAIIHNVEANHKSGAKKSKASETTLRLASGGINLNDEVDEVVEETQEVRPIGKRSEEKQSYIELKHRELSIREVEVRDAAQLKREKLETQRRTLELAERDKRDKNILFYNSEINSSLPAIQQQKLLDMKLEIKA